MASHLNWSIFKRFSRKRMLGFSFQDVVREFPEKHPVLLSHILADMIDEAMLVKISRDNYHIIPADADPENYGPDGHQVAKYIMKNKGYYIGYASAMQIHGIGSKSGVKAFDNNDPGQKEFIVTAKQMTPVNRSYMGRPYRFIHHENTRFFGYNEYWINHFEKAMVSDLEKTIVDMFTMPQFCGRIAELGHAIFHTKERIEHDKLFFYFARNRNKSAKKRFLFLSDLLKMEWTDEHDRMMDELGTGISLLDPLSPDRGKICGRFGLKINEDPEQIKTGILHY